MQMVTQKAKPRKFGRLDLVPLTWSRENPPSPIDEGTEYSNEANPGGDLGGCYSQKTNADGSQPHHQAREVYV